jgi:hypothetical protein
MVLPIHDLDVEPVLQREDAVVEALKGEKHAVYWIPGKPQDTEPGSDVDKAWKEKHEQGPIGFLLYQPEGSEPMGAKQLGISGALCVLIALVLSVMLRASGAGAIGRFGLVVGVGIVLVLFMDLQAWNWQGFPMDWTRGHVLDHLGGMGLLALVLSVIVRRPSPAMDVRR